MEEESELGKVDMPSDNESCLTAKLCTAGAYNVSGSFACADDAYPQTQKVLKLAKHSVFGDKRFLRRWINPYLEKIFSIPDRLIDDSDKNLTNILSERSSEFKETFIEPCSGSGAHLIELARSNPEAFFVGFEKRYKRAFRTAEKSDGLKNLLVIRGEVDLSLFKDSSTAGVYLNFPDPWEKNQKNRVLNKIFIDELSRILAPNGFFSYKTDHKDSFESAKIALRERFLITNLIENASKEESGFQTEFEGLFRSKNLPIFVLRVKQNRSN